jgi:hypothetical protein
MAGTNRGASADSSEPTSWTLSVRWPMLGTASPQKRRKIVARMLV